MFKIFIKNQEMIIIRLPVLIAFLSVDSVLLVRMASKEKIKKKKTKGQSPAVKRKSKQQPEEIETFHGNTCIKLISYLKI